MLNPQWLRTFTTLAELRNFTRTAEHLDLTQAAISQHVGRLEERLGPLLVRRPRKPDDPRLSISRFATEPLDLVAPAGVTVQDWADLQRLGFIDHPDGKAMASRLLSRRFPGGPGVRSLRLSGFTNQISLILESVSRGQRALQIIKPESRRLVQGAE